MEINGIAHVMLTVSSFDRCVPFYERILIEMGLRTMIKSSEMLYCVGGRTAVGVIRGDPKYRLERFVQTRIGLHHFCFRARERGDIDKIHEVLKEIGAKIVHAPQDGPWAPGYYSVLFEDPDGIRLEVNHVPGKGLLAEKQ